MVHYICTTILFGSTAHETCMKCNAGTECVLPTTCIMYTLNSTLPFTDVYVRAAETTASCYKFVRP